MYIALRKISSIQLEAGISLNVSQQRFRSVVSVAVFTFVTTGVCVDLEGGLWSVDIVQVLRYFSGAVLYPVLFSPEKQPESFPEISLNIWRCRILKDVWKSSVCTYMLISDQFMVFLLD